MELVTALDWFFYIITQLGEEMFYIVALAFVYWSFNKKLGKKLAIVVLSSLWLNGLFKFLLKLPRPPKNVRKIPASGYGFPSGHAQGSTTFWGYLTLKIKRTWFYVISVILVTLISYSRIYLRVHYVWDIIGGLILGITTIVIFELADRRFFDKISNASTLQKLLMPAIYTFILLLVPYILFYSTENIKEMMIIAGALFGITEGFVIEEKTVRLEDCKTNKLRMLRFVIGMIIVLPVIAILRQMLSGTLITAFLLYAIIGLLMGLGVPYVFKKLKL